MTISEKARNNFKQGLNCSQSVIEALCKKVGLDAETAKAVSVGFGGGMGREQKTCGAVSGGIMAIGCSYFDKEDLAGSKEKAYGKTKEFIQKFEEKYGSSDCRELLGVDINTPEGKEEYKEKKMVKLKCSEYIKDACEILEEII